MYGIDVTSRHDVNAIAMYGLDVILRSAPMSF